MTEAIKKLTKDLSKEEKKKLPKLNPQRSKFLANYLKSFNAMQAYIDAEYKVKTMASAAAAASRLLTIVKPYIEIFLSNSGYTQEAIQARILEGMGAMETQHFAHQGKVVESKTQVNWTARVAFARLAAQCKGMLQPDTIMMPAQANIVVFEVPEGYIPKHQREMKAVEGKVVEDEEENE